MKITSIINSFEAAEIVRVTEGSCYALDFLKSHEKVEIKSTF